MRSTSAATTLPVGKTCLVLQTIDWSSYSDDEVGFLNPTDETTKRRAYRRIVPLIQNRIDPSVLEIRGEVDYPTFPPEISSSGVADKATRGLHTASVSDEGFYADQCGFE